MKKISGLLASILLLAASCGQNTSQVNTRSKYDGPVKEVIVVFKMHFDIGYTQWAEGVLQQYSGPMLEKTLQAIDKTAHLPEAERFVWTVPAWPLKYMLENCSAELKPKLEKAIREQRIITHALPFTFETEASDLEPLVRGLGFASDINRKYGLPLPRDAKLTDVPSHSHVLPTLLKNAGIDILHIGCNPGSASPEVPTLFWWEGTDGSKLLTFNWAEYYGSGIMPPKNWKHKTWLAMIHTHENTGGPTPEEVAALLKSAREQMPDAKIRIGRLSDFYDQLIKENPDLPVIKGDMPDTWIHGYLSTPREISLSKKLQREAFDAEVLNTQLRLWNGTADNIDRYVDQAVENMLLFDEHTFGVAMTHNNQQGWAYGDDFLINKSLGYYSYAEGSWLEKANRVHTAERLILPVMNRQIRQLAASVATEGKRIVVYNTLPWERSGVVSFFAGVYQKNFNIYAVKDLSDGKIIPVHNDKNLVTFETENIPACGYKTYIPLLEPVEYEKNTDLKLSEKEASVENKFFRLVFNTSTGELKSVYDKSSNMEIAGNGKGEAFGSYVYEQFGQDDLTAYNKAYVKPGSEGWANQEMGRPSVPEKKRKVYNGKCRKIVYSNLTNAVRATVFGYTGDPAGQEYLLSYTLYENQPYIEINWGINGKKPDPMPEAGWLAFPFNIEAPEYRLYRTGGIVDPKKDFIPRSNLDYCFLNTSIALYEASGTGYAINTPSAPGISIGERGLYKFSGNKEISGSTVWVNMFNTQWGTNFAEWTEGSFSHKLYIWSFSSYDPEKCIITPGEETRTPLYGVFADGPAGKLANSKAGIRLSRKGILVTAFGNNRDGEGTVLRIWDQSGTGGNCTVTMPEGSVFSELTRINLRGVPLNEKNTGIKDNSFSTEAGRNKPLSFILK